MDINHVIIKIADFEDCKGVLKLINDLAKYENMENMMSLNQESFQDDLANSYFKCYVAKLDNKIVGYTIFVPTMDIFEGNTLFLEDIFVQEGYRGFGIGSLLWRKVVAFAEENNCTRMNFQVSKWNTPSIKFYENRMCENLSRVSSWELFRKTI